MKLNENFLLYNSDGETVLVPTGKAEFSGVVRGNATFGAILQLLKTETTEEQIVASLKSEFSAPEGAIERDVAKALFELRQIGAIDE